VNNLSYTQFNKFQECPTAWKYHYKEGYRPIGQSANLLFGSAIDKAIEALLKDPSCDPYIIFDRVWNEQEINKKLTKLSTCTSIQYSNSDYDEDLLLDKDKLQLQGINVTELQKKDKLTKEEKEGLSLAYWISLYRKGEIMINTFQGEVLSKINKIHAVQKQIKLDNGEGDTIVGYIDLICDYADQGNVIFDVKTASKKYDENSVFTSQQLALYTHAVCDEYKTRKAGYIVLIKQLNKNRFKVCSKCGYNGTGSRYKTCPEEVDGKRCNSEWIEQINPECLKQVLIDTIPEQTENIVIENMDYINKAIKAGVFYRNLQNCIKPYGKCPFFGICYKGDYSEVVKV